MLAAHSEKVKLNSLYDQRSGNWRRVDPLPRAVKYLQRLDIVLLIQNCENFIAGPHFSRV